MWAILHICPAHNLIRKPTNIYRLQNDLESVITIPWFLHYGEKPLPTPILEYWWQQTILTDSPSSWLLNFIVESLENSVSVNKIIKHIKWCSSLKSVRTRKKKIVTVDKNKNLFLNWWQHYTFMETDLTIIGANIKSNLKRLERIPILWMKSFNKSVITLIRQV